MHLNHVRKGEGEPLVLIHGLGGSLVVWEPVIDLLAAKRDVVAVDMPGFGGSDCLPGGARHSAVEMGRAITAHCRGLGIERPHVAGNSLGAWVALEMAADGNAASVCGISPAGLWRRALGPRSSSARRTGRRLRPLVQAALRTSRGRTAIMRTSVARPELMNAREAIAWTMAWLDAPAYDDANERMRALVFDRGSTVEVPTTVAWGEQDRLVGPPRPERMPRHTRYLVMPGWGHTPTRDDPEGVVRLLLDASSSEAGDADPALRA